MRLKQEIQLTIPDQNFLDWLPKGTFTPDPELLKMSEILDSIPQALNLVAADLLKETDANPNSKIGRPGITAEQVLRTAILKQKKGYSYRELVKRIDDSIDYRRFTRFGFVPIPHFSALEKLIIRIRPETYDQIDDMVKKLAQTTEGADGKPVEDGKSLRLDCCVVETDIVYPIDARLLNDSVRVLTRILTFCRNDMGIKDFNFANRTRRAKKRAYQIVLQKGPGAVKKRRKLYRSLLQVTQEVINMAEEVFPRIREAWEADPDNYDLEGAVSGLEHFIPLARQAVNQCQRRVLNGEKVPAEEKIVSIFEEHTDIICRGKSGSPTEFGHKILFATGRSGMITHHNIFRGNPGDNTMLLKVLDEHIGLFGQAPEELAGDRRFFSALNEKAASEKGVKFVSIPKPGKLSAARKAWQKSRWFKELQRFRAGIEGNISNLLRNFGLKRCL
ncbi:MAG: ISNCY family transposase [candidate division Zixibacteria bacterium]|nr:ISNCY family transposase [Candidatus Tariuqbacter arcticus]